MEKTMVKLGTTLGGLAAISPGDWSVVADDAKAL